MGALNNLHNEYSTLKKELFPPGTSFAEVDDHDQKRNRYNQLFQFFYPQYQTSNYVNPIQMNLELWYYGDLVFTAVARLGDLTRSDAQGLYGADDLISKGYEAKQSAEYVANEILNYSTTKA